MRVPGRSRQARWRRLVVGTLAALVVTSCGGGEEKPTVDPAALQEAWNDFARCTVGPPLAEGESASYRMLRAELTQLATGGDAWPASCSALSEALVTKLQAAGERYESLRKGLGLLSGTTPDMYLSSDEGMLIDRIFEAAAAVGLTMTEGGDGPVAPPLAEPATKDQRTKLGTSKSVLPRVEETPGPLTARVVYATIDDAIVCRIGTDPKTPLQGVQCDAIDWEHGTSLAPVSSEARDATYVWDDEPKAGVWRVGGESAEFFKIPASASAFVHADGTIVDAGMKKRKMLLARRLSYGKVEQAQLKGPAGGRFLGHTASVIVWRGPTNRITNKASLVLQRIKTGRVPVSGERRVGDLDPSIDHAAACRTGDRLTIMVLGDDPLEGEEHQIGMVSLVDDDWTRLVTGRVDLGKDFDWKARGHHAFQCTEEGAAFTWIRADGAIGQALCSQESCRAAVSKPMPSPGRTLAQRVATVGDQVLWLRAMQGKAPMTSVTEIVSMRMAPIDKLDAAPVRVLVGDENHGGLLRVGKSLDLLATGPAAVALVRNDDDVYGIRIAADGSLSAP